MQTPQNRFARFLKGLIVFYLAVVVILFVASLIYPVIEARGMILTVVTLLLFLSLPLVIVALLLRAPRLTLGCLIAAAGWGLFYVPYLLPRDAAQPVSESDFTILTFNLKAATQNIDTLVEIIEDTDTDIVALQELSVPTAAQFEAALSDDYPEMAFYARNPGNSGAGVMSRFPIEADEFWQNSEIEGALGNVRTEIDINGTSIALYSVHPRPPVSFDAGFTLDAHSEEVNVLMDRLSNETLPTIIAGDFNMTPWMDEYDQVSARYVDTFREAGATTFGFTFPAGKVNFPLIRLDYVFHDESFVGVDSHPWKSSGESDHQPFWTSLAFAQ
jgi:endonuclease/exonuclease/phosphatase (EEP) superfamily protein YafD